MSYRQNQFSKLKTAGKKTSFQLRFLRVKYPSPYLKGYIFPYRKRFPYGTLKPVKSFLENQRGPWRSPEDEFHRRIPQSDPASAVCRLLRLKHQSMSLLHNQIRYSPDLTSARPQFHSSPCPASAQDKTHFLFSGFSNQFFMNSVLSLLPYFQFFRFVLCPAIS